MSLLAAASLACSGARGEAPKAVHIEPIAIRVAPVSTEVVAQPVIATGTLGPKDEIPLSFKIAGVVHELRVDAGASVKEGDTLATLELPEIDAAVARARSGTEKAERDLARARRLYTDSVVTLSQVQDANTGAQVAAADLETALFNRRHAVIVAPAGGVILSRRAEPGQLLTSGTTALTFGSHARGAVIRLGLADRDVVRIHDGDRATVHFDALPDRDFTGRVTEIAAAAEPSTGTYAVEVALPEAAGLASGLVGRVEIRPSNGARTTLVPIEALLEADGNEATVYTVDGNQPKAVRHRVTIAFISDDRVAISRGLENVTSVITDGASYLQDGAPVKAVP
jgi:RND family efflux transporter MFP subunit